MASHLSSTPKLVGIILANTVLGTVLASSLAFVELYHYRVSILGPRVAQTLTRGSHEFLIFFYNVASTNLFTALLSFTVVLALLAALIHQLIWPVISRPVYAAHRYGLIAQHKLLTTLGASCLLLAWPNSIFAKAIAKAAHLGG